MVRTIEEIEAEIGKLEEARKITRARNGYRHYSDRINGLRGERLLLLAKQARKTWPHPHWDGPCESVGCPYAGK